MEKICEKFLLSLVLCGLLTAGLVFAGNAQAFPPIPPTGLSATAVSSSEVHLNWIDMSDDESGFVIERNGSPITTVSANVTNYKDKCLNHDTSYLYRVSSYNADGSFGYSEKGASTFIITTVCSSGCNHSSIQAAIDVSCDGDTISVGNGTYYENIDFLGKDLAIQSVNGAESTIIDGNASGSVVTFENDEGTDSLLDGFTITNGSGRDVEIFGADGGGIYCFRSSPMITNCIISGNSVTNSGGGIVCFSSSSPTISNCVISNNSATYLGGGIACAGPVSPTIINCVISSNTANYGGGIAYQDVYVSESVIESCTISDNLATNSGGGIYCAASSPRITNCTVSNNTVTNAGGGGIYVSVLSSPKITNCTISNNSVTGTTVSWGGGVWCQGEESSPTIANCIINGNTVTGTQGVGGGICADLSSPTITNCIISNNLATGTTANWGGGIASLLSSPRITNCTISNNSATGGTTINWGGGIYCLANSSPMVVNSILWGNTASLGPNEIDLDWTSSINVTYSDIQGGYTGTGNINANPLFGANYHLTAGSPCIDAGTDDKVTYPTLPTDDIDGDVRPYDVSSKPDNPSAYDMGADEYVGGGGGIYCYDISLTTGWNLISLPLQPTDTAIESVLSIISSKYASVWAFQNSVWKVYDPANPDFSDLTQMEAGWGYWINMNVVATLTTCGTSPPKSIPLIDGWNLVGYNSLILFPTEEALASIDGKYVSVWAFMDGSWKVYDPANPDFSDLLIIEPNYGYWINTTEACSWSLP